MYDNTSLADNLQSQVRANERKEQEIFDVIRIMTRTRSDEIIAYLLVRGKHCETNADALRWLGKYIDSKSAEEDERHDKEIASLATRRDDINKTLAQMDNRIGDDNG